VALHELARRETEAERRAPDEALVCTCYSLLETVVEVLAQSQEMDPEGEPALCMPDALATLVLTTVHELVGVVLEFLEDLRSPSEEGEAEKRVANESPLLLASTRMVGCFLAQVPGAYTQRVLALLELMLSTTALPEGTALEHADTGGAVGFLLPYLRQVTLWEEEEEPNAKRAAQEACAHMLASDVCMTAIADFLQSEAKAQALVGFHLDSGIEDACEVMMNLFRCPEMLEPHTQAAAAAVAPSIVKLLRVKSGDSTKQPYPVDDGSNLTPDYMVSMLKTLTDRGSN